MVNSGFIPWNLLHRLISCIYIFMLFPYRDFVNSWIVATEVSLHLPGKSKTAGYLEDIRFIQGRIFSRPFSAIALQYLADNDSRAAEPFTCVASDPHHFGIQASIIEFLPEPVFVKVLVEPECNHCRIYLFYRAVHINKVSKAGKIHGLERIYHPESLSLGNYRLRFVAHIFVPGNDDMEFVAEFLRLLEIVQMTGVQDIKCPRCNYSLQDITSSCSGDPSAL